MLRRLAGRMSAGLAVVARALAALLESWARRWDGGAPAAGGPPADWVERVRAKAPWLLDPADEAAHFPDASAPPRATTPRPRRQRVPGSLAEPAAHRVRSTPSSGTNRRGARTWRAVRAVAARAGAATRSGIAVTKQVVTAASAVATEASARTSDTRVAPIAAGGTRNESLLEPQETRRIFAREDLDATARARSVESHPAGLDLRAAPSPEPSDLWDVRPSRRTLPSRIPGPSRNAEAPSNLAELPEAAALQPVAPWPDLPATRDEVPASAALYGDERDAWPDLPPGIADDESAPPETLLDREHRASLDAELRSL